MDIGKIPKQLINNNKEISPYFSRFSPALSPKASRKRNLSLSSMPKSIMLNGIMPDCIIKIKPKMYPG